MCTAYLSVYSQGSSMSSKRSSGVLTQSSTAKHSDCGNAGPVAERKQLRSSNTGVTSLWCCPPAMMLSRRTRQRLQLYGLACVTSLESGSKARSTFFEIMDPRVRQPEGIKRQWPRPLWSAAQDRDVTFAIRQRTVSWRIDPGFRTYRLQPAYYRPSN